MYQQQATIYNDTDAQSSTAVTKQRDSVLFWIVELNGAITPKRLKLAPVTLPCHLKPVGIELRVINASIVEDAPNHQQAIGRLAILRISAELVRQPDPALPIHQLITRLPVLGRAPTSLVDRRRLGMSPLVASSGLESLSTTFCVSISY